MVSRHAQLGLAGEGIAARYLKKNGYRLLERNYRNAIGEIDIIAVERETIAFIEVKTRQSDRFGSPKWAVTSRKQRKLSMVALCYLKAVGKCSQKARFDVVAVSLEQGKPVVEIIKNAFDLAYG